MSDRNDVFVSYAHADNQTIMGAKAAIGWVHALAQHITARPGLAAPTLFVDYELQTGDAFPKMLKAEVARSDLLLIILSQNYIDSQWCSLELQHYLAVNNRSLDDPTGVMVVELQPFEELKPNEKLPEAWEAVQRLRAASIHGKFWDVAGPGQAPDILGYPTPGDSTDPYWPRVGALAKAIRRQLDKVRDLKPPQPKAPSGPFSDLKEAPVVLLADVTEDLESDREKVKLWLQADGVIVLPDGDYVGMDAAAFDKAFKADLARSGLFVQLLSRTAGRAQRGYPAPGKLAQLQYQLASKAPATSLLQWCEKAPSEGEIDDPGHAALFATPHLRTTNLEALKDEIAQRLQKLEQQRRAAQEQVAQMQQDAGAGLAGKHVFIDDEYYPALGKSIRDLLRRENCHIRSLPRNTPLGGAPDLMRPCKGGLTVYADKRDHPTVHHRLIYFLNQVAEKKLPLACWGVYFDVKGGGSVADDFGIDSDDVIGIPGVPPLNVADLKSFLSKF